MAKSNKRVPLLRGFNRRRWPDGAFRWVFEETLGWFMPPGFERVNIGIDNVWAIRIDGRMCHPDYGDIVVYGDDNQPLGIERDGVML
jgi:hypothetical protein